MPDGVSPLLGISQRLPPANMQAEQALLGALLANNKAYDRVSFLRPEHFADPIHSRIFEAIVRHVQNGELADAITLKADFEHAGVLDEVGGTAYLAQLLTAMVGIINAGEYGRVIHDAWLRRQVIDIGEQAVNQAFGGDPDGPDGEGVVSASMERLLALGEERLGEESDGIAGALQDVLDDADAAYRGETAGAGLVTGIGSLDALWAGLWPGALDILGARSEHGKTALGMQIARAVAAELAREAAARGTPPEHVGVFSLEMPKRDLMLRMLAAEAGVPADDIRWGRIGGGRAEALIAAQQSLAGLPLLIRDRPGLSLSQITMAARIMHRRKRLRLIVIDHLHRIGPDRGFRGDSLALVQHNTAGCKDLARLLNVPVLLLAQLSRESERREDPRPRVSDIKYAGEADGDNVILLWRPELHMGNSPPALPDKIAPEKRAQLDQAWWDRRQAVRGKAEAIFAKRRFGATGSSWLRFDGPRTKFYDPDAPDVLDTSWWSRT